MHSRISVVQTFSRENRAKKVYTTFTWAEGTAPQGATGAPTQQPEWPGS